MKEKIKIIDESGDKKYFSQLPHYILNHSTAIDQALYWQMKRYAGENGKCFATQETLIKKLGIGTRAYNKSLNYLLDRKWIRFVGMTKGKTRPIRTYAIVDIWKLNIMEYDEILAESTVSFKEEILAESKGDTCQKHSKILAESTVEEEPPKEDLNKKIYPCNASVADINKLIELFKPINPSYERLFSNKTQRAALERLVKKYGEEKTIATIEALPDIINKPYAPRITTPYELERDLAKLVIFFNQEKGRKNLGVIKV